MGLLPKIMISVLLLFRCKKFASIHVLMSFKQLIRGWKVLLVLDESGM